MRIRPGPVAPTFQPPIRPSDAIAACCIAYAPTSSTGRSGSGNDTIARAGSPQAGSNSAAAFCAVSQWSTA